VIRHRDERDKNPSQHLRVGSGRSQQFLLDLLLRTREIGDYWAEMGLMYTALEIDLNYYYFLIFVTFACFPPSNSPSSFSYRHHLLLAAAHSAPLPFFFSRSFIAYLSSRAAFCEEVHAVFFVLGFGDTPLLKPAQAR